ncbi:uncharacterized protein BDZ99DRAFT_501598 [Mytilinidion resinicola]|uniref:Transcription initiation factor TFIID subunit 2 n=1 Tax=Mytilinidion resinicola TaxID=574789 RepID=A0A6A6YBU0_9PEZI|nr:uncharacterized protein BDZ99DRAFT_501598 [Mytilinidion resinicola]KAF2806079.1 hypothetical protein BDZ99DRAFT_501598 [Mytilinidion resinicola]
MPEDTEPEVLAARPDLGFTVLHQKVQLEIDFASRLIKGKSELTIQPTVKDLRTIRLDCRQLKTTQVTVEGRTAPSTYSDLYQRLHLYMTTGIYQHHFPKLRIDAHKNGKENELVITLPKGVNVKTSQTDTRDGPVDTGMVTRNSAFADVALENSSAEPSGFDNLQVVVEYYIDEFRDGLAFVGVQNGDGKYPHLFTRNSPYSGIASCLFPCLDDSLTRCTWDFSIRCPRTLGDALRKPRALTNGLANHDDISKTNGTGLPNRVHKVDSVMGSDDDDFMGLDEEEKLLEMAVICSGDMTDEIVDVQRSSWKTVSFNCETPVLPQHIAFAVGPFEHVDLSEFRDSDVDERLGSNASRIHAFCLPGRAEEVLNSAEMLAQAADFFTEKFLAYPFTSYKVCFVDDLATDVTISASMSICSTRLLYPKEELDPINYVTRMLVYALASQWIGVYVIPQTANDWWIIVGGAWFITDLYLRELFGKNDYKYRLKLMADKIVATDVKRPSIQDLGPYLALDPGEMEFMELKAPLVLSILHQRLVKQSGKNGVDRCFWRMLLNAKASNLPNSAISTEEFYRICEKVGHQRLDKFFTQWVEGGGCPSFHCTAKFNKKKMLIEMQIDQIQGTSLGNFGDDQLVLNSSNFMREVKEDKHHVYAATTQHHFTGPMTIRIHEADGTPYEHIVDIQSRKTKVDIPYNTKYKRLKRSRRQKERAAAAQGIDITGDAQDDVLLYCLGDVLQSGEEVREWKLYDWSKDEEDKMNQESYEWYRIDADFEWICKSSVNMPSYMYVSQLQQDKDIVAQLESIQWLSSKPGHELLSSILVRTLMDGRYFHGIRTIAADALANCARAEIHWIGLDHLEKAFKVLFCRPGTNITRPNDFSDRSLYLIRCAIPKAIARIRDTNGKATMRVKTFISDLLKYNDNGDNPFSDSHYVATLMSCLTQTLTTATQSSWVDDDDDIDNTDEIVFQQTALSELGRLQRSDEWISSFQNVITTTALECSLTLMQNRVIPRKPLEFMKYTKLGNADNVRLKAWNCLVELGMIKQPAVLTFMIYSLQSDPSPYFRERLLRIFGYALGQIALGELKDDTQADQSNDILQIDQDDGPTERQADLARKTSVNGALAALSKEISEDKTLKKALEEALRSHTTSLRDMEELLEICGLLYEPEDSLTIALRYPRYWKTQHRGRGVMKFSQTERIRSKPMPKPAWAKSTPKSAGPRPAMPKRTLTLTMGNKAAIAAHVQAQAVETQPPLPKIHLVTNGNSAPAAEPPVTPQTLDVRPPIHRSASSSQTLPSQASTAISPPPAPPAPAAPLKKIRAPKSRIVKFKVPQQQVATIISQTPRPASSKLARTTAAAPSAAAHSMHVLPGAVQHDHAYIKRQSPSLAAAASLLSPAASGNGSGRKRSSEDTENDQRPLKRQASTESVAAVAKATSRPSLKIKLKVHWPPASAPSAPPAP